MSEEQDPRPYLVITVLLDGSARPAAISRSHGDAYERSLNATQGKEIAGVELTCVDSIGDVLDRVDGLVVEDVLQHEARLEGEHPPRLEQDLLAGSPVFYPVVVVT